MLAHKDISEIEAVFDQYLDRIEQKIKSFRADFPSMINHQQLKASIHHAEAMIKGRCSEESICIPADKTEDLFQIFLEYSDFSVTCAHYLSPQSTIDEKSALINAIECIQCLNHDRDVLAWVSLLKHWLSEVKTDDRLISDLNNHTVVLQTMKKYVARLLASEKELNNLMRQYVSQISKNQQDDLNSVGFDMIMGVQSLAELYTEQVSKFIKRLDEGNEQLAIYKKTWALEKEPSSSECGLQPCDESWVQAYADYKNTRHQKQHVRVGGQQESVNDVEWQDISLRDEESMMDINSVDSKSDTSEVSEGKTNRPRHDFKNKVNQSLAQGKDKIKQVMGNLSPSGSKSKEGLVGSHESVSDLHAMKRLKTFFVGINELSRNIEKTKQDINACHQQVVCSVIPEMNTTLSLVDDLKAGRVTDHSEAHRLKTFKKQIKLINVISLARQNHVTELNEYCSRHVNDWRSMIWRKYLGKHQPKRLQEKLKESTLPANADWGRWLLAIKTKREDFKSGVSAPKRGVHQLLLALSGLSLCQLTGLLVTGVPIMSVSIIYKILSISAMASMVYKVNHFSQIQNDYWIKATKVSRKPLSSSECRSGQRVLVSQRSMLDRVSQKCVPREGQHSVNQRSHP